LIRKLGLFSIFFFYSYCSAESNKPNILFCIADDWGYHASAFGDPVLKTPIFDQLVNSTLAAYTKMLIGSEFFKI